MSNSSLVTYVIKSPNNSGKRTHSIDTITIHHMAGNLSVERCGEIFASNKREASSNYGVSGKSIGLYVDEENRSWCSSSATNDQRAITIEVSNDASGVSNKTWTVSDETMETLIKLVADICKRNGIKKLVYSTNKEDRVNHRNGCNMTLHKDFIPTLCPGPYLESKMPYIADRVNAIINGSNTNNEQELYRVRKSWGDAKSQLGAYKILANAKKSCPVGYNVYNRAGEVIYSNTTPNKKTNEQLAREVICGKWGNGAERKNRLESAGYNYYEIQKIVNKLMR